MKQLNNEIGYIRKENSDLNNRDGFMFDDSPIYELLYTDEVLYSKAIYFKDCAPLLEKLKDSVQKKDTKEAVEILKEMSGERYILSLQEMGRLAAIIGGEIPHYVHPIINVDITYMEPILTAAFSALWSQKRENIHCLVKYLGTALYRYYEHVNEFDMAVSVTKKILSVINEKDDSEGCAILLNNMGYQYLMAQKYKKAIKQFDKAYKRFQKNNSEMEMENSRLNRLRCEVEIVSVNELERLKSELSDEKKIMKFHAHKRHFVEAKIYERLNDIPKAIEHCQKAIEASDKLVSNFKKIYEEQIYKLEQMSNQGIQI